MQIRFSSKDKWSDYDCIFSLFVDANRNQRFQLEMHDENNLHQPNGYVIDLQDLRSVTYARGRPDKNEPDYIVTLQVKAKRHRFGFDENNTFNQWKSLLDTALNATASSTRKEEPTENEATNLLYESSNGSILLNLLPLVFSSFFQRRPIGCVLPMKQHEVFYPCRMNLACWSSMIKNLSWNKIKTNSTPFLGAKYEE